MALRDDFHGAPQWVWIVGGTAVVAGGVMVVRRRKAAAATAANSGSTNSQTGFPSGAISQPLPGLGAITPIILQPGLTVNPTPVTVNPTPPVTPTPPPSPNTPPPTQTPPPSLPKLPAGESFVSLLPDPAGGWIAQTNKGGIYNFAGSPFYGSAYSASGSFGPTLQVNKYGGYTETNNAGIMSRFGPQIDSSNV